MKSLRRFCMTVVLTLALNLSVVAGDMHFPKTEPTPPPPAPMTLDGDMHTPVASTDASGSEAVGVDPMREFALNLMLSVLSLF